MIIMKSQLTVHPLPLLVKRACVALIHIKEIEILLMPSSPVLSRFHHVHAFSVQSALLLDSFVAVCVAEALKLLGDRVFVFTGSHVVRKIGFFLAAAVLALY